MIERERERKRDMGEGKERERQCEKGRTGKNGKLAIHTYRRRLI